MYKFTQGILPLFIILPIFFGDYYCSQFNSDSCVTILYTKKGKFATKIAYVQDEILPQPQKLYTGLPVTPVTNSRSEQDLLMLHSIVQPCCIMHLLKLIKYSLVQHNKPQTRAVIKKLVLLCHLQGKSESRATASSVRFRLLLCTVFSPQNSTMYIVRGKL